MITLEKTIKFEEDERYGYITVCPSDLGNAMLVHIQISLPHLTEKKEELKAFSEKHKVNIKKFDEKDPDNHLFVITKKN